MCVRVCVRVCLRVQSSERTCVYLFFDGVPSDGTELTERLLLVQPAAPPCNAALYNATS